MLAGGDTLHELRRAARTRSDAPQARIGFIAGTYCSAFSIAWTSRWSPTTERAPAISQALASRVTPSGADDRARTGDLNLGKVALYQLSYVRVWAPV